MQIHYDAVSSLQLMSNELIELCAPLVGANSSHSIVRDKCRRCIVAITLRRDESQRNRTVISRKMLT
jgi:hypothetical protein